MEELMSTPLVQSIVPVLVIAVIAALIFKAAKGCIKFLIAIILLAVIVIYIVPRFLL